MAADVLDVLAAARGIDAILVVTSDRDAAKLARAVGADVVDDQAASSHSEAAELGVARARRDGARRVLLVAGDCPLVDGADLERVLVAAPAAPSVVIVTDRHGSGTNALLLTPPDVIRPSFGDGSRHRHGRLADAAGASCQVVSAPTLELDIDTPQDLALLSAGIRPIRAPRTQDTLRALGAR